ncbi:MAG: zf-HC2 domain-containing protein [Blastocatellia bacterium]|nr:zf-HC2 domain-containing protein [Blastocatellia bacterium]
MNCRRIEKLIPLYVEGDIEGRKADAVLSHLNDCESCSLLTEEYLDSQRALRMHAPPEFDDALFDSVRRAVSGEIERAESHPSFFRFVAANWKPALAAIALFIVFGGLAFYISRNNAESARESVIANEEQKEKTPPPERAIEDENKVEGRNIARNEADNKPKTSGHNKLRRRATAVPDIEVEGIIAFQPEEAMEPDPAMEQTIALEPEEVTEMERESAMIEEVTRPENTLRIEIQTSDPNIRIIWFATKKVDLKEAGEQGSRGAGEPLHSITQSHPITHHASPITNTIQEVICLE